MEEWKEYKLGEISTFSQGVQVDVDKQYSDYKFGRVRFIRIVDFTKNDEPVRYIDKPRDKCLTKDGDIVMIRYGSQTAGLVARSYDGAIANNIFKITFKNAVVSNDFGYYYLSQRFIFDFLRGAQSSSTMPAITFEVAGRVPLLLPSINEQDKITSVLKSLDDKIEVNRRINENLEQQAQALFKSWFVDFEPFKNGEFVESELGRIPKGLDVQYISEISHILETGRRPKGGVGNLASGIPSVGAEHVKGMGNYDYSKTKFISQDYANTLKTGRVKGYELLIYKDGGKPGYFIPNYSIFGEGYPFEECYLNEHVFKLDFSDRGYNIFCYFFFKTDYVMNYLNAQGGKAAIPGINRQDIENILIFTPKNMQVQKFGKLTEPIFKKILINCKESRRLAELRDTLLPKLMSGELRVQDTDLINEMLEKGIR